MGANDSHIVRYSIGTGRNLGRAKNLSKSLKDFVELFQEAHVTEERQSDYSGLPEEEQKALKSCAGWLFRTQVSGPKRNRSAGQPSEMLSYDFDKATPEFLADLLEGRRITGWEWMLHTTRRHTAESPRIRLFVFLNSPISNDDYEALSRIVCRTIDPGLEHVDKVSFRPAQMMFFPTVSSDQDYIYHRNEGELIDPQNILDTFELMHGDWHDIRNLPKVPGEELRKAAKKAEDPTTKEGPVGDFCRAYNVMEAIEAFLPDKYEPVDIASAKPRYTYLGGTTTNGAEVQDDGLFLYSHHGSDPVGDMLVNSFDLVRIHLFGDQDKFEDRDLPITKQVSYLKMLAFIRDDPEYKKAQIAWRYDTSAMMADFDDEDVAIDREQNDLEEDLESAELVGEGTLRDAEEAPISRSGAFLRMKRPLARQDWTQGLELTDNGRIIPNLANLAQILDNDGRTRDVLAHNEFTGRVVIRDDLKTKLPFVSIYHCTDKVSGTPIEDHHVDALRAMLESPNGVGKVGYGLKVIADRDMNAAVEMMARRNAFHPVREYLRAQERVPQSRAELAFIRYFGCPDTPYYRQVSRLWFIAAVARVFEPGHKFDFCPILSGGQGKRKSMAIKIMGKGWAGELKADFKDEKKMVEQMLGNWINELPELSSIGRSAVEDVKAFLAGSTSIVRLSYDRRSSSFPRQGVFIGSTNDDEYLIDTTGNRRFWPVPVLVPVIDTDGLVREIDALWADAYYEYLIMRQAQPHGTLPLYLTHPEAIATHRELTEAARVASEADSYAQILGPWLDRKIGGVEFDDKPGRRKAVSISECWMDGMEMSAKTTQADTRAVGKALRLCGWQSDGKAHWHRGTASKLFVPGPAVLTRWAEEDGVASDETDDLI